MAIGYDVDNPAIQHHCVRFGPYRVDVDEVPENVTVTNSTSAVTYTVYYDTRNTDQLVAAAAASCGSGQRVGYCRPANTDETPPGEFILKRRTIKNVAKDAVQEVAAELLLEGIRVALAAALGDADLAASVMFGVEFMKVTFLLFRFLFRGRDRDKLVEGGLGLLTEAFS